MAELENVDWWGSDSRSRDTLVCVLCVGLGFALIVLSPIGWVGLVIGLLIGSVNVYFSLYPDTRFYPGRLATSQPRGPEQHPRILYRILFLAAGLLVIWDSVRQFLHHRG
jgi:hypothetical protein